MLFVLVAPANRLSLVEFVERWVLSQWHGPILSGGEALSFFFTKDSFVLSVCHQKLYPFGLEGWDGYFSNSGFWGKAGSMRIRCFDDNR